MVDIKSLRLGSYVMYEQFTHVVTGIHGGLVWSRWINGEQLYICDPKLIYPIHLTEEILLKCGFEKLDDRLFKKGGLIYDILDGEINYFHPGYHVEVKHLHRLQNIFYETEGIELDVEL